MFQYTIFAASEARMAPQGFVCVTLFGATNLKRPSLAQRVLTIDEEKPKSRWWGDPSQSLVLTIFGATEVSQPTLMEEYSALRSLVTTGAVTRDDLRARLRRLISREHDRELTTLTLFGAFADQQQSRNKQLKALANGEKAGVISAAHRARLDDVAGTAEATGIEVLGELVSEMA